MIIKLTVSANVESTGDMKIQGRGCKREFETRTVTDLPDMARAMAEVIVREILEECSK